MPSAPPFLRESRAARTVVLLYHRVADLRSDPQLSAVSVENFSEHLQVIAEKYRSARVSDLMPAKAEKSASHKIIVTFDDGYADNFCNAFPLLDKYGVPATIFITTNMVENRSEFWWDFLYNMFFLSESLPEKLRLKLERDYEWSLPEGSENFSANSGWNLLEQNDPSIRHQIYRTLCSYMRMATAFERARVLDELSGWASYMVPTDQSKSLSIENIREMSRSEIIEIGSHSVNHPVLSSLSLPEQRLELEESRKFLQEIIDFDVNSFAYPYGTKRDYTTDTMKLASEVGYSVAASNIAEVVWSGTNRFEIPRLLVRNCDGDAFEKWLSEWFGE